MSEDAVTRRQFHVIGIRVCHDQKSEKVLDSRLISTPLKTKIKCYLATETLPLPLPKDSQSKQLLVNIIIVVLIDSWLTIAKKKNLSLWIKKWLVHRRERKDDVTVANL